MKTTGKHSISIRLISVTLITQAAFACSMPRSVPPLKVTTQALRASVTVSTSTFSPFPSSPNSPTLEVPLPTKTLQTFVTTNPTANIFTTENPPTTISYLETLPPGQYVVYTLTGQEKGLYAISTDNAIAQRLTNFSAYAVTPDGKKVLVDQLDEPGFKLILNLENNELIRLPASISDCDYFSGLADLSRIAMWCKDGEIYVFSLEDQSKVPITHITKEEQYYFFPLWSPDGKWIAYFDLSTNIFRTDPEDGLYLVDTSCLSDPGTCPAKAKGPFQDNLNLQGPYSWSPDSQMLAIPSQSDTLPIKIFDLKTEKFHDLRYTGGYGHASSMAWSPDGEWIAYSQRESETNSSEDIFLTPARGGKSIQLVNSSDTAIVYFWLTVPLSFHIGDTYSITNAGANLNLRQTLSLSAKALMKLQPGEQVQILEGSVEADGYSWWKVRVISDGMEGWLVEQPDWYKPVDSK